MTGPTRHVRSSSKHVGRGVIAIIKHGPRYLTIRRADRVAKGGYWCFPGGHVEPGENSRRAVRRELEEELGIEVLPVERLGSVRVLDPQYILAVWRVEQASGELRPATEEIADVRWLLAHEVRAIEPGLPSTQRVMDMLESRES